jgi:LPXTG-motif cell wall-anchored protein
MEGRTVVREGHGTRTIGVLLALMVVLSGMFLFTGVASAQETCTPDPYGNEVCDDEEKKFDPEVEADVLTRPETPPDDSGETLPFTGADVTLFVITGAALVATGVLVVRRTRASKNES